jgi:hypothetical protein
MTLLFVNNATTAAYIRNPKPETRKKSEIRSPKPATKPERAGPNEQNRTSQGGLEHWIVGSLNLFRLSGFGFRVSAPSASEILSS